MRRKRLFLFFSFLIIIVVFLGGWTAYAEGHAHYTPEYEKVDITSVLQKEWLTEEDYELLFYQTGMAKAGVDALWAKDEQRKLLYLQERFFEKVELECLRSNLIVQSERLVEQADGNTSEEMFLPEVQAGDILISFSGHVFGWRNGHAAIVVDEENGLTLEAITLGSNSRICSIKKWAEYPCFALLRLKGAAAEERAEIADYAKENLVGISYHLFSFAKECEALTGTHCSHLVWSAFARFGYDLDSDDGMIITPRDIYESDLLEIVQTYGMYPVK